MCPSEDLAQLKFKNNNNKTYIKKRKEFHSVQSSTQTNIPLICLKELKIVRSITEKQKYIFWPHRIKLGSQQQKEIWKITKYLKAK